jgi:uncharacterized protein YecE (DUF72 family)
MRGGHVIAREGSIRVGTSGWNYGHWKGPFYPEDARDSELLGRYAERFNTVEVNNTFYQLPATRTIERWVETVPDAFVFAVKASRYITHMKKLKDPRQATTKFLERIEAFGEKLGPVLFQLQPKWRVNADRLAAFLEALPSGLRCTFEFRDESWYEEEVYGLLRRHGAAFCVYELAGHRSPREVTAGFAYVRLHGPERAYQGSYSREALSEWAAACSEWSRKGDVYCYFNNDELGYAPRDALRLRSLLGQRYAGNHECGRR